MKNSGLVTISPSRFYTEKYLILLTSLWSSSGGICILGLDIYQKVINITILNFSLRIAIPRLWQKSKSGRIIIFPYLYYKYFLKIKD